MRNSIRPAIVSFVVLTLITGVAYPLAVTCVALTLFPKQASGSLFNTSDGKQASTLIGQSFAGDRYFWPRPSAAGTFAYNPLGSAGSNLGPSNPALAQAIQERVRRLKFANPSETAAVPVDLVTASASGLDPHISVAAAEYQIGRVARARGVGAAHLRQFVTAHIEPRTFGLLGEPRVNVLALNLDLDHRLVGTTEPVSTDSSIEMYRARGFINDRR